MALPLASILPSVLKLLASKQGASLASFALSRGEGGQERQEPMNDLPVSSRGSLGSLGSLGLKNFSRLRGKSENNEGIELSILRNLLSRRRG